MGKRITEAQADQFRADLKEGYSLTAVAERHGVNEATVKKHASFDLSGRQILLGTEVHITGQRGRWEFAGEIGYTSDGQQYAKFINTRTGRSRIFYTLLITTVHRDR